ncbi:hypothetical protein ACRRTK_004324 [Alexandromys fortis]
MVLGPNHTRGYVCQQKASRRQLSRAPDETKGEIQVLANGCLMIMSKLASVTFKATFQWCVLTRTWDRVEESSSLCNNTEQFTQDVQRHKQKRHNELSQGMLTAGESHPAVPVPMAPNATDVCCFLRNGKRRKQTAGQQEEEAMFIRATQATLDQTSTEVNKDAHAWYNHQDGSTCFTQSGAALHGHLVGQQAAGQLHQGGHVSLQKLLRMPMASITVQGKAHTKKVVTAADRDGKTKCDVSQQYWDEEKSRKGAHLSETKAKLQCPSRVTQLKGVQGTDMKMSLVKEGDEKILEAPSDFAGESWKSVFMNLVGGEGPGGNRDARFRANRMNVDILEGLIWYQGSMSKRIQRKHQALIQKLFCPFFSNGKVVTHECCKYSDIHECKRDSSV